MRSRRLFMLVIKFVTKSVEKLTRHLTIGFRCISVIYATGLIRDEIAPRQDRYYMCDITGYKFYKINDLRHN